MRRHGIRLMAAAMTLALVGAACGGGGDDDKKDSSDNVGKTTSTEATDDTTETTDAPSEEAEVSIWPLAYRQVSADEAEGVSSEVKIRMEPSDDEELRVSFSEEEVGGTGDQWRAAAWNAVTVGTLLTGSPLQGHEFTFELSGRIDGPSAGALMTIGVISLLRGDEIQDDVTMTGTINPDGTVGPVGGISYKVDGVVAAGKERMFIPAGQRNDPDAITGEPVDIVAEGRKKGITVDEVGDIYDAYEEFTGVELPKPGEEGNVELSEQAYENIKAKVGSVLADARQSVGEFDALDPTIKDALQSTIDDSVAAGSRAEDLSQQGLQAGAYTNAIRSAALANAAVKTGRLLEVYFTQGVDSFLSQLNSTTAIDGKVRALFDQLRAFTPTSVSDVSAVIDSFGNGIDALSLSAYGDNVLANLQNATDETTALQYAALGAILKEFSGSLVDGAEDVFEVGRGLGGAEASSDIDLASVSDFFRKAAEANLAAFDAVVLQPAADQNSMSLDAVKTNFAGQDFDYALATSALNVIEGGLDDYLEDESAQYAEIGGSVALYARSAGLIAKYYSLQAELDENLNVIGVGNDRALSTSLDLAKTQVEHAASLLIEKEVDPTLVIAAYEAANVDREGDASDKFSALSSYWAAYVESRVLAYIGGFESDGMDVIGS